MAALFSIEFDDFQNSAGVLMLRAFGGLYNVFGNVYGQVPMYGENKYQYTRSLYGYSIILKSK